ncbi:uncharacterized protein LOC5578990 [Aedes aegypti]|uniref:Uncharacterized protein n=1 Tax=Aedes aegypti TaxID=7159 RepID=A0A903VKL5_AEDAE|nr:uncharacterized protein LOC5578990 [Aedes aegypti]
MVTLNTPAGVEKQIAPIKPPAVVPSVSQPRYEHEPNSGLLFSPDDLSALLAKTETGQSILRNSLKGPLSKDSKKELSIIIADHHILRHFHENNLSLCRLPKAVLENYVHCIKLRFPAEIEDMVTYYIPAAPPERKNPGGSIYQAYKRLKGAKRDRERRELQHAAKLSTKENRSPERAEQSEANRWLSLNNAPWDTVLKMWKTTEAYRFEQIKLLKPVEIIAKFRHYAEPLGYQLIDADYHSLGFSEGIANWTELVKKLKPYFILKVHDEFSMTVLEYMNHDDATHDVLVCCTLILLNCCVKPCKINKNARPAILTAQEDILMFAANVQSGVDNIRKLFESYATQNIPPHPKVIALGSSYRDMSGEFYVVFDRLLYKTNSVARAVDIVIKMCNVMNIPFSKVTKLIWYTVEETLYNIRAPAQYKEIEIIKKLQK